MGHWAGWSCQRERRCGLGWAGPSGPGKSECCQLAWPSGSGWSSLRSPSCTKAPPSSFQWVLEPVIVYSILTTLLVSAVAVTNCFFAEAQPTYQCVSGVCVFVCVFQE